MAFNIPCANWQVSRVPPSLLARPVLAAQRIEARELPAFDTLLFLSYLLLRSSPA